MTEQTLTRSTTALPRVNLLPSEIGEARRMRRIQAGLGGGVALAAVAVGMLYVQANGGVSAAQSDLDTARQQTATVQTQVGKLANVTQVYNQVAAGEAMLDQAMGQEVRWSKYLTDLSLTVPDKVWLTSLAVTQTVDGAPGAAGPAATAGAPTSIGTVTFAGTAYSHDDVAVWLETLAKQHGYADAYLSSSTEKYIGPQKVADFSSTVTVTPDAYEGRYGTPPGGSK